MKKILLLVLVILISTACIAQAATKVAVPVKASSAESKLAITSWGGLGGLSYDFNDQISAMVGANYTSTAGTGVFGVIVKADYNLFKVGKIQNNMGLYYTTLSSGATGTLGLTYGVETMVQPNLLLGMDFILVSQNTTGGFSTTSILPATALMLSFYI